jgi:hypothetical protein
VDSRLVSLPPENGNAPAMSYTRYYYRSYPIDSERDALSPAVPEHGHVFEFPIRFRADSF